ncbi:hypothetical protein K439DRAFT_113085 [Ramaria rubella]|nr:hypothetical protein K439DRAFT_113085 [Ramaria rubella]
MQLLSYTVAFGFTSLAVWAVPTNTVPKNILIDTDFLSFPDDVGALALANAFQQLGKANILGIASDLSSEYTIPAIDAINTYYFHPDIPFGQNRILTNATAEPNIDPDSNPVYVTTLADFTLFPEDIHEGSNKTILPPLEFYHGVLSKAEDDSVTIISIGFMNNLNTLYHSEGGKELIQRKVKELIVEGGDFTFNQSNPGPQSAGYNMLGNLTAAKVLEVWPTPITFLGDNIGSSVLTGAVLKNTPKSNPVRAAYGIYLGGICLDNMSWDLLTTYFSVLGIEEGSFQYGNGARGGKIQIYDNGTAGWDYSAVVRESQRQHFLDFRESNVTVAKKVDELLTLAPSPKPKPSQS